MSIIFISNLYDYQYGSEFNNHEEAIAFAINHDWSKTKILDHDVCKPNCELIGTTNDDQVDIYFEKDNNSYFFVYTGFIQNKNIYQKFQEWLTEHIWKFF